MSDTIDNEWRADTAQAAVHAFAAEAFQTGCGEDNATVLGDLMVNLMHLCDREGINPWRKLMSSYRCYREEVTEDGAVKAKLNPKGAI